MIITIDGYAGTGKSSICSRLSKRLNLLYVSSGSLYRAITMLLLPHLCETIFISDEDLDSIRGKAFSFSVGKKGLSIDGVYFERELRSELITEKVPFVATDIRVRKIVNDILRKLSIDHEGIIVDGRDMGTEVFPDATYKFFFNADVETRARHIGKDLSSAEKAELKLALKSRDDVDINREIAPIKVPVGAILVDSFANEIDDTVSNLEAIILQKWVGKSGINSTITGKLTERYETTGDIIVVDRPTYDNIWMLRLASGVVFREALLESSHEFSLFRDYCVPYVFGIGNQLDRLLSQNVTLVCDDSIGYVYPISMQLTNTKPVPIFKEHILISTMRGMEYYSELKARTCAIRGEFIILQNISKHPLSIFQTSEELVLREKLKEILIYGSSHFDNLIYRFSDFSSENLQHLEMFKEFEKFEVNTVIGNRGAYRLLNKHKALFLFELDTVSEMVKNGAKNISVLIPFVRSVNEAIETVVIIKSTFPGMIGCMIEVPSMLFTARKLDMIFDFFVIGCADCLQLLGGLNRDTFTQTEETLMFLVELIKRYFLPSISLGKRIFVTSELVYSELLRHESKASITLLSH